MFYSNELLSPKVQFTLIPIKMTDGTNSFTGYFDGQKVVFSNVSQQKTHNHLMWPKSNSGVITIGFVDNYGKYYSTSYFGQWALFKMFDKASIVATDMVKHFNLTLDLNGNAIKFDLYANDAINPFILEIVNNFRCSDKLSY